MILLIDNYDSFTWNLAQAFMGLGEEVRVVRNDDIDIARAESMDFDRLVISPGPGSPERAGQSVELIRHFAGVKPILGVCLGHQAIGAAFGGRIVRAARVMHGKTNLVSHDGRGLFADMPNPMRAVRYHSLCIARDSVPEGFEITATASDGEIMGISNRKLGIEGVQFHPESVGTEEGLKLLRNFVAGAKDRPSFRGMLKRLSSGEILDRSEAEVLMDCIAAGGATQAQTGAFLTALTLRGPSVGEIAGFAACLRARSIPLPLSARLMETGLVDTCGTGGDNSGTFNISTASALVAAGAGVLVAKHGNRSVTSRSGSADLLEALGIPVDLSPAEAVLAIEETGFAFLAAPAYHPAFKALAGARKELGFRTVFNMMGPLLNPARPGAQVMGVYDPSLTETAAATLAALGTRRAFVVHGLDGVDEISLVARTKITELRDGWTRTWMLDPEEYGFSLCESGDLKGGTPAENAAIVERILGGEQGPKRDVVVLNAAAAILVAGKAADFGKAVLAARESLDSGSAATVLDRLQTFPRDMPEAAGGN